MTFFVSSYTNKGGSTKYSFFQLHCTATKYFLLIISSHIPPYVTVFG